MWARSAWYVKQRLKSKQVRQRLRSPYDTVVSYFYARVSDSGIGIESIYIQSFQSDGFNDSSR